MNSKSDDGVGGFIRSYADRVRADALEKAAELTGAVPPPWATGKPPMSRPLDLLPPPAPPAPPSPEPGAPMLASPPSLDAAIASDTIDPVAEVETDEDRSEHAPRDGTAIEDRSAGDIETAIDDTEEARLPPVPEIDPLLDDTAVAQLEDIVEDTRDELRQWKRELRWARRDLRRQHRYQRRFGPESE